MIAPAGLCNVSSNISVMESLVLSPMSLCDCVTTHLQQHAGFSHSVRHLLVAGCDYRSQTKCQFNPFCPVEKHHEGGKHLLWIDR